MRSLTPWALAGIFLLAPLAGCISFGDEGGAQDTRGSKVWSEDDPALSQPVYTEVIEENVKVPSFDGKLMDNWVFRPKTPDNVTVPVFINFSPYWTNLAPDPSTGGDAFSQYLIDYFVPRGYAVVLSSARGTGYSEGCFNLGGSVEQQDAFDVVEYFAAQPWSNGNVGAGGKSYDGTIPNGVAVAHPPSLKTIIPVSPISELYKYNYKDGLSYGHGWRFNQYYYMGVGMDQYGEPKTSEPGLIVDDAACPYLPEMQAWGLGSGLVGDSSEYWEERNYTRLAANADASMWLIHGLQDWNVKPDNILPWMTEYGGPVKAWLHQWTDGSTGGHVYPMRADWNLTMLRWLDHWLKGADTGIMDEPAVQVQDDAGAWRHEQTWPPADVEARFVPLDASGSISDAIGFSTAFAVDNLTRVAGEISVHLTATSTAPNGRVIVELSRNGERLTYGGLNLRHRDGIQNPQPVVPGQPYDVDIVLHPVDAVLRPGDDLIIAFTTSLGPYFVPPMAGGVSLDGDPAILIKLPAKQEAPVFEDPAPVELENCWAC